MEELEKSKRTAGDGDGSLSLSLIARLAAADRRPLPPLLSTTVQSLFVFFFLDFRFRSLLKKASVPLICPARLA